MKNKKYFLLILLIVVVLGIGIIVFINNKQTSIYYRTYTKESGWSKWVKNGKASGNEKYDILKIEVKVKSKFNGVADYSVYQDGKWSKNTNDKTIYGVKFGLTGTLGKEFRIYYRTYNSKDKWMGWTREGFSSGNNDSSIKKIQIKLLQNDVSLEDYLEDYNDNKLPSKGLNGEGEQNEE